MIIIAAMIAEAAALCPGRYAFDVHGSSSQAAWLAIVVAALSLDK
jgi:hypothetical protein